MLKRSLCSIAAAAALAACGGSSSSSLCDKAGTVSNNLNGKVAGCLAPGQTTNFGVPTGQTCTQEVAQCNSNDQTILSNSLDCLNNLPNCTTATATQFASAASACAPTGLSTACNNAINGSGTGGTDGGTGGTGGGTDGGTGGGTGGGTATGSCNLIPNVSCIDYSASALTASQLQQACTQAQGTWSSGACPTAGRSGSCTINSTGLTQVIRWYGSAYVSAGQQACTSSGGTWTNG